MRRGGRRNSAVTGNPLRRGWRQACKQGERNPAVFRTDHAAATRRPLSTPEQRHLHRLSHPTLGRRDASLRTREFPQVSAFLYAVGGRPSPCNMAKGIPAFAIRDEASLRRASVCQPSQRQVLTLAADHRRRTVPAGHPGPTYFPHFAHLATRFSSSGKPLPFLATLLSALPALPRWVAKGAGPIPFAAARGSCTATPAATDRYRAARPLLCATRQTTIADNGRSRSCTRRRRGGVAFPPGRSARRCPHLDQRDPCRVLCPTASPRIRPCRFVVHVRRLADGARLRLAARSMPATAPRTPPGGREDLSRLVQRGRCTMTCPPRRAGATLHAAAGNSCSTAPAATPHVAHRRRRPAAVPARWWCSAASPAGSDFTKACCSTPVGVRRRCRLAWSAPSPDAAAPVVAVPSATRRGGVSPVLRGRCREHIEPRGRDRTPSLPRRRRPARRCERLRWRLPRDPLSVRRGPRVAGAMRSVAWIPPPRLHANGMFSAVSVVSFITSPAKRGRVVMSAPSRRCMTLPP